MVWFDIKSINFNILIADMHEFNFRYKVARRLGHTQEARLLRSDWEQLDAELQDQLENLEGPVS